MMINTYDYQHCEVFVESPHPDDVVFWQVMGSYLGRVWTSGISDVLKTATIPQAVQDINNQLTDVLFQRSGLSLVIMAHAILTTHVYLLGPSLASEDLARPLLATAEYVNNMGIIWGTWKPIPETSDGNSEMINLLNEGLSPYYFQGSLLHSRSIKVVFF